MVLTVYYTSSMQLVEVGESLCILIDLIFEAQCSKLYLMIYFEPLLILNLYKACHVEHLDPLHRLLQDPQ